MAQKQLDVKELLELRDLFDHKKVNFPKGTRIVRSFEVPAGYLLWDEDQNLIQINIDVTDSQKATLKNVIRRRYLDGRE